MLDFARDPKFWERVRNTDEFEWHRREIKELYSSAFKTEPRAHSVEDVLSVDDKGLWRLQFDQLQSSAILSLIYPENEEYYNNLLKIIWAYLNEYTWAPLGHYTEQYYQRTPKDFDYGLLDIFACSAAFALAEIKSLFKDRFPTLITDRITYELRRRAIEPYLTRKFFWESHNNNWTAVCAGAIGGVLMYEEPALFFENQERLHKSMECYLASYNDDGMCVEGVGYWSFGFGFFASYAMLEREITNGKVDWFKQKKIKEISKFLQKTFLQRDTILTFSDTNIAQTYSVGLPHMLHTVYGDEIEKMPKAPALIVQDNTHFNFALRSFIYYSEEYFTDTLRTDVTYTADNSCYLIKRTKGYGFATKGGNNGESHNHIDVGSFILARNNKQIICDVGAGPYYDGYHTSKRYTFFYPSAYAHNIPIIDGIPEDDIARDDVYVSYDEKTSTAYMDISPAYKPDFIKSVKRSFKFEDYSLTLTDSFTLDGKREIKEHFVSVIKPQIFDGYIMIDDFKITTSADSTPTVTEKELERHLGATKYTAYIIEYTMPKGETEFTIECKAN